MNKANTKETNPQFKRKLGLTSLIAVGTGIVVAQGCFVSILQGVGTNGGGFMIAMLIAFILTLCYAFTFSELSLMMPKAGSISTYTEVAIGHFPAIIATIAGYVGPAIFAGPAELFLVESILDMLYPGAFSHVGLWLLGFVIVLNILGVEIFSTAQNILAFTMLVALLVVGVVGLGNETVAGAPVVGMFSNGAALDWGILPLTVLALWAFLGLEFICPLIEEIEEPKKNVPKAMVICAVILLVIYAMVAMAGYQNVPGKELISSSVPHWLLISAIFGSTGKVIMAVLAITATCSTLNTAAATIPRMLYGMAQNHQLPIAFAKIHPRWKTPWFSTLFMAALLLITYFIFKNAQDAVLLLLISAATVWLVAYIISHINLIVLRKKYPNFHRPYRSPWYPWPQVVGIIGMTYLFFNNSPAPEWTVVVYMIAGTIVVVTALYAWLWIKFKMKKDLFKGEPIEKVLAK